MGAYETLFNGRSRFGVSGSGQEVISVGAIILDDAHVALSSVRSAFTLDILASKHNKIYKELTDRFRQDFREVGRGATFSDITSGRDFGVIEVPSWAWNRKYDETRQYLSDKVNNIDPFVWPFLRDNLEVCHCLFRSSSISITPIFPLVDLLPTFERCARRVYMSATIADDSEIVRTFGASKCAVSNPVTSESLAGVGERMILVPELMKLGAAPILPMVEKVARRIAEMKHGVVILSPSRASAEKWSEVAECPATANEVSDCVRAMQNGDSHGPIALANRYDGIDLAGSSCRYLVLDDLPQGATSYDIFRMNVAGGTAVNSLLAQRIEQGIGRGTRGGADYCVVMLVGSKVVGWIGRRRNLDFLTASTRVQLRIGQDVSEEVNDIREVGDTILKCLNRDEDWVGYHATELAEAARAAPVDSLGLEVAAKERKAFRQQQLGQYAWAMVTLEEIMEVEDLQSDPQRVAWLVASAARIAFQMGDDARGQELQTQAFSANNSHCPPRRRPTYSARPTPSRQSLSIVERLKEYDRRRGIIADFDEAVSALVPEASSSRFEESLAELGTFLGFQSERPENVYGVGPDVLWRTDGEFDFVIEAKNEKEEDSPLFKREHAQLLEAEQWFKKKYPGRNVVRVSALPEPLADEKATPEGSFALRLDDITLMASSLRNVLLELVGAGGNWEALDEQCETALRLEGLTPKKVKQKFMRPFGKGRRK